MKRRAPSHPETPLPTEAELAILSILWTTGPATVREVHDALAAKQIGYTTVLKQMQVMAEKGLLERSERFRSHVYGAALPKEQTQQQLAGNLLHRAFEGSAKTSSSALSPPKKSPPPNSKRSATSSKSTKPSPRLTPRKAPDEPPPRLCKSRRPPGPRPRWTLLHFLWQGALVALILACILSLLSRRSAQPRYLAACCALVLIVALPLVTFTRIITAPQGATQTTLFLTTFASATTDRTLPSRSNLYSSVWQKIWLKI